jgi:hypothetical protein
VLPAFFASLVLLMAAARKKKKKSKNVALVMGTYQTLSNLVFLLISMAKMKPGIESKKSNIH